MMLCLAQNRDSGFTLIELMAVIVIMGVLSTVIVPKLFDVSRSAEQASVEAVSGAFSSGVYQARAAWIASGNTGAAEDLLVSVSYTHLTLPTTPYV